MKKYIYIFLLLGLFVSCSSDDEDRDLKQEQYSRWVIGNWVPDDWEKPSALYTFNNDGTGIYYVFDYYDTEKDLYVLRYKYPIKKYEVKKTNEYKGYYIVDITYEKEREGETVLAAVKLYIEEMTENSIFTGVSYFNKVSTINIEE